MHFFKLKSLKLFLFGMVMDTTVWIVGGNREDYVYFISEEEAKNHMMKLAYEKEKRLKSPWVEIKVEVSIDGREVQVLRRSIGMFVNGYFSEELKLHYFPVTKYETPLIETPPLPPRKNIFDEEIIAGTTAIVNEYTPGRTPTDNISVKGQRNVSEDEYATPSPINLHERTELSPDGDYVLRRLTEADTYMVKALMYDAPKRAPSGVNAYTWI